MGQAWRAHLGANPEVGPTCEKRQRSVLSLGYLDAIDVDDASTCGSVERRCDVTPGREGQGTRGRIEYVETCVVLTKFTRNGEAKGTPG